MKSAAGLIVKFLRRVLSLAWVRRLPLTREGLFWLLISLAMLVTGLLRGINLINLLACWIVTLVLWNWWMARRQPRRVKVRRILPDHVFAQTPFRWAVEATNLQPKPAQSLTLTDESSGRSWFVGCVPAGETVVLEGESMLPRRGVYRWDRLRVASSYPVGLANVVRTVESPEELVVFPQLGAVQRGVLRHWLSTHCPTHGAVRAAARRQPNAQHEFHGLRSFRPGDSPRHIHWRTTARRGELMVREFEDLPNDNLILIVDPWTLEPAPIGANADLERLLSLAATIVWEWCRQKGDDFVLALVGDPPVVQRGPTGRELARIALTTLANVTGGPNVTWTRVLEQLEHTALPPAAALVLSLRRDVPIVELERSLRRPVALVNVGHGEEQAFFTPLCLDVPPAKKLG